MKVLNSVSLATLFISLVIGFSARAEVLADFTINRTIAGTDVELTFESQSTSSEPGLIKLSWDFGDQSPLEDKLVVQHHYEKAGEYLVKLTAENAKKEVAEKTVSIVIKDNKPPKADFYVKSLQVLVGKKVNFMSMSSDEDGDLKLYEWRINGQLIANDRIGSYVFSTAGKYRLTHTVIDELGAEDTSEKVIEVSAPNLLPQVELDIEKDKLDIGRTVGIRARAQDPDGQILHYYWKFDELTPFEEGRRRTTHVFARSGLHRVWVKVVDDRGGETTASEIVFVDDSNAAPVGKIRVQGKKLFAGKKSGFSLRIAGLKREVDAVEWDFGDGSKVVEKKFNPRVAHVYAEPGRFEVKAKLIYSDGKSHEFKEEIEVIADRTSLLVVPNQVLIFEKSYIELVPTQTLDIAFWGFDLNGNLISLSNFSSVVWSSSNSNVSITSQASNFATIKGISPGSAVIKVTVDGVESQPIEVSVHPFVNGISAAKRGEFFDSPTSEMYVALMRSSGSGTYKVDVSYNNSSAILSSGAYSDYISDSIHFELPSDKTSMEVKAEKTSAGTPESFAFLKMGLKRFAGRNGFFYKPNNTDMPSIIYSDDRIQKYDRDFSISFWLSATAPSALELQAGGDFLTRINDYSVKVQTATGVRQLNFPEKPRGAWAHIAITYNRDTRVLKAYYDGHLVGTTAIPNSPYTSNSPYLRLSGTNGNANASLDELKFWNKELTSTQVKNDLFSPVALPSADLLASFNFDTGTNSTQADDNGGTWRLNLNSYPMPGPTSNMIMRERENTLDSLINKNSSYAFSINLDERPLKISVPVGMMDTNEQLEVSIHSCLGVCAVQNDAVREFRMSPVVHIAPLPLPHKAMQMRIPFDSHSPNSIDPQLIKIVRRDVTAYGGEYYEIYAPDEVNSEQGYVGFQAFLGGDYWVTVLPNYRSVRANYSNQDLRPSLTSYWGKRTFYTAVPAGTNQYTLNVSSLGSSIVGLDCQPSQTFQVYFPIVLTGLQSGLNHCYITYLANPPFGPDSFYLSDLILISKP